MRSRRSQSLWIRRSRPSPPPTAIANQVYTVGTAIDPLVLPEATGGDAPITYNVLGLPAGLEFDPATRTLSGTPTAVTDGPVRIFYTVSDVDNQADLLILLYHGQRGR